MQRWRDSMVTSRSTEALSSEGPSPAPMLFAIRFQCAWMKVGHSSVSELQPAYMATSLNSASCLEKLRAACGT
ncbi:unnamed protein product [Urochloa humidicola]